jgi:hypothetical protein
MTKPGRRGLPEPVRKLRRAGLEGVKRALG